MIDVITPLYNKEPFVRDTIASVVAQSFSDWRLYVTDDGSNDSGPTIVETFADPRITLIRQGNRGVGLARNAGIAAGSGEIIAFLDADDLWNGDHLKELAELHRNFPAASFFGCGFSKFAGARALRSRSLGSASHRIANYFRSCSRGHALFCTSSVAVLRSVIDQVGAFKDLSGNEDVELWARLALHGPLAVSRKRTVHYRLETGGITDQSVRERSLAKGPLVRAEVSSVMPTLNEMLPRITDPRLRADVIEYMDSRVGAAMVAAVRRGRISEARKLRALYVGKPSRQAWRASLIAKLPPAVARVTVQAAMLAKRTLRHLRS